MTKSKDQTWLTRSQIHMDRIYKLLQLARMDHEQYGDEDSLSTLKRLETRYEQSRMNHERHQLDLQEQGLLRIIK